MTEAKDVLAPRYAGQIEAQIKHARDTNQPFNLVVSPRTTRVPQRILDEAELTGGGVFVFDAARGTLTRWAP